MTPEITVFIPVYNGAKFISQAIESVLKQTFECFKLIIIDNCSTDETLDISKKYINDVRIIIISNEKNIGAVENFNKCLLLAKSKYYAILSHDDFFYSTTALQKAYEVLEANLSVPIVYANMMFVDINGNDIIRKNFGYNGFINNLTVAKRSIIGGRNYYSIPLLTRSSAIFNCKYTSEFPMSSDVDIAIAIGKNSMIYYLPETLLAIRFHSSNNTARTFLRLDQEFSNLALKYKLQLTLKELLLKKILHYIVVAKKILFFIYLDNR